MRQGRLAVIMDPIESIKPATDSTLAMLVEADRRGWEILYGRLEDIWLRDGNAFGRLTRLGISEDPTTGLVPGEVVLTPLGELDLILMRKDPPFDTEYIFATYILERAALDGALVVNRPQALRDANEKVFTAWFPDLVPATLITRSMSQMGDFLAERGKAVVKPLDAMGGRSVFVVEHGGGNTHVVLETLTDYGRRFAMIQEYLPEIADGDKRILLIDGKPVPHVLARIPPEDDHRGNISSGASTEGRALTDGDRLICERVGPVLRDRGILFCGIDVIGRRLTEINSTSATGVRELDRMFGLNIAGTLFDAIDWRLAN